MTTQYEIAADTTPTSIHDHLTPFEHATNGWGIASIEHTPNHHTFYLQAPNGDLHEISKQSMKLILLHNHPTAIRLTEQVQQTSDLIAADAAALAAYRKTRGTK